MIDKFKGLISKKDGMARSSVFQVILPSINGVSGEEVNLLCKDVQLPGRQILTSERRIGMQNEKIPYGYAVTDTSMTFHLLNDYGVRKYFETWQNLAVNQETKEVGYQKGKEGYAKTILIRQLKKGFGLPVYSTPLGLPKLPAEIQSRLPKIGPFDFAQGELDLDFVTKDQVVYSCRLIDAFPTSMNAIQLNNELDGLVELNVQLSYTNWEPVEFGVTNATEKFIKTQIGTALSRAFS
jgi:hypothetical protein